MARIRSIKPETLSDPKSARLSDGAWRLWVSMWMLADDTGRLPGDEAWLHAQVFWARPREVAPLLTELVEVGFVKFYEANGEEFCWVKNFNKHQRIDKPQPPKYPPPPEDSENVPGMIEEDSRNVPRGIGREGKGREVDGIAREQTDASKPFAQKWADKTGVLMPDAYALGEASRLIGGYAQAAKRPRSEVEDLALDAFAAHVATWSAPQPLTPQLFVTKWDQVQGVMAGKVPKRAGDKPPSKPQEYVTGRPKYVDEQ